MEPSPSWNPADARSDQTPAPPSAAASAASPYPAPHMTAHTPATHDGTCSSTPASPVANPGRRQASDQWACSDARRAPGARPGCPASSAASAMPILLACPCPSQSPPRAPTPTRQTPPEATPGSVFESDCLDSVVPVVVAVGSPAPSPTPLQFPTPSPTTPLPHVRPRRAPLPPCLRCRRTFLAPSGRPRDRTRRP